MISTLQRIIFGSVVVIAICGTSIDSFARFTNGEFESGMTNQPPASWTTTSYLNNTGITLQTPQSRVGLNLQFGGTALTTVVSGTNMPDVDLGPAASLRYPLAGNHAAIINFHGGTSSSKYNANSLSQIMVVGAGDVDSFDGRVHIRFALAPVLQNPDHTLDKNPYLFIFVTNISTGAQLYSRFIFVDQIGLLPWKRSACGSGTCYYTDWQLHDVVPGSAVSLGDQVKLEVIAAGCALGAHYGEAYIDSVGTTFPFLNLEATGPSSIYAGNNIVYSYTYKNGGAAYSTNAVITIKTPNNTTFQGLTTPAGFTCLTPSVDTPGTITCSATGSLAPGAVGTMQLSVMPQLGTLGIITHGEYGILSDSSRLILGPVVETNVLGCRQDSDCGTGTWCNVSTSVCTPKVANGKQIPIDTKHSNPTLSGICTTATGAATCQSGVCDTADNLCGYANGDGTCSPDNASAVCRSSACGGNNRCGIGVLTIVFPGTGGTGRVTSDIGSIDCSTAGNGNCSTIYNFGELVALTPSTDANSTITGWIAPCSGLGVCNLIMNTNIVVGPNFSLGPNRSGPLAHLTSSGNGYDSIADAYSTAISSDVIQAVTGHHVINELKMDRGVAVTLKGGFDNTFSGIGSPSVLQGTITISNGTLRAKNIKIKP